MLGITHANGHQAKEVTYQLQNINLKDFKFYACVPKIKENDLFNDKWLTSKFQGRLVSDNVINDPCKKCDCKNRLKIDYNHMILINNLRCNNHHVIRFLSIISVILIIIDLEYFFKNRL